MKVRQGFVTNSSSSSFIISAKKDLPLKAKIEVNLKDLVKETLTTLEQLEVYRKNSWMDEDSEDIKRCKEAIERGEVIHIIHVSSEDEGLSAMLHYDGLQKVTMGPGVSIIQGDPQ